MKNRLIVLAQLAYIVFVCCLRMQQKAGKFNYLCLGQVKVGSQLPSFLTDDVTILLKSPFQVQQLSRRKGRANSLRLAQRI